MPRDRCSGQRRGRRRSKFFVFLEDPDVPATNNACEREIRPSVVFRKVTGGFRSNWGARIHAGYRSVTGTAKLHGQTALQSSTVPPRHHQQPESQVGEQLLPRTNQPTG
jgi:transposase IS66 family protein